MREEEIVNWGCGISRYSGGDNIGDVLVWGVIGLKEVGVMWDEGREKG